MSDQIYHEAPAQVYYEASSATLSEAPTPDFKHDDHGKAQEHAWIAEVPWLMCDGNEFRTVLYIKVFSFQVGLKYGE